MTAEPDDDPATAFVVRRPVAAACVPGLSIAAAMFVLLLSNGGPIGPGSPAWPLELVLVGWGPVLAFVVVGIVLSAETPAFLWIVGACGVMLFGAAGTVGLAAYYGVDLGRVGGPWWVGAGFLVLELSLAGGVLLAVLLAGLGWCARFARPPAE
ncbi:hypothetical protein [Alienimonas californiensis]|uniref:Uncharacterized protein n=1 Tax=Alienimonas californiensis TaxID=2527989 RepID=A0A517P4Z4_9PLAN|nr:hypothetical protein [Alienimonas californiensis]QDT14450.1 hypothetical protein CA12_05230 [Alienimonas californiensis]